MSCAKLGELEEVDNPRREQIAGGTLGFPSGAKATH